MTWHLKDRELEKKLIAIDTDFIERLNQNCEIWDSNHDGDLCELMHFEQILRYKNKLLGNLLFTGVQLEEVSDFNPNAWNEYPAVKPPEGEMMRVEYFSLILRKLGRTCAIFCNGQWFVEIDGEPDTEFPLEKTMIKVKRFRPWED